MAKESKKSKVVDLSEFFTTQRMEEGVWFEPTVYGKSTGLEFKVIGADSDEAAVIMSDYAKDTQKIEEEDDPQEKNKKTRELLATYSSKLVKDIRVIEGYEVKLNGDEVRYSKDLVYNFFYESPRFAIEILNFARRDSNFTERKSH